MSDVIAFTHRDQRQCFLPTDVIEALNKSNHVRQGRVIVFAENARSAWRLLTFLGLEQAYAHRLVVAHGNDVDALIDAGLNYDGATFARPLTSSVGKIVQILPNLEDGDRHLSTHLEFYYEAGKLRCRKIVATGRQKIEVTEAMMKAALDAHDASQITHSGTYNQMHAAITAALQAREGD